MNVKITNRQRQIIDAATDLFSRVGYKSTTMKQLAEACEVTEAALYKHFESKAAIYIAVLESLEERLVHDEFFDTLEKEDDIEKVLQGLAEHILTFFGKNEDVYRLLLYSALEGHERARYVFSIIRGKYIKFLHRRLNAMYKLGLIVEKNNEITARCFIGMVFDCALGYSLWKGMQGRVYDPVDVVGNNIPIYVEGLKKR